jgi:hypothetical protein
MMSPSLLGCLKFSLRPCRQRVLNTLEHELIKQASTGVWSAWEHSPRGRLALIVLLDQFPRNIYRGTPEAFAHDAHALRLCLDGQNWGHDRLLRPVERLVVYLPMQHAEDLTIQERSVRCMERLVDGCRVRRGRCSCGASGSPSVTGTSRRGSVASHTATRFLDGSRLQKRLRFWRSLGHRSEVRVNRASSRTPLLMVASTRSKAAF